MPPQVGAGDYSQLLIHRPKVQTVGEPTDQRTPNIGMNNRKPLRRPLDRHEPPFERVEKYPGHLFTTRPIPPNRLGDIAPSHPTDD